MKKHLLIIAVGLLLLLAACGKEAAPEPTPAPVAPTAPTPQPAKEVVPVEKPIEQPVEEPEPEPAPVQAAELPKSLSDNLDLFSRAKSISYTYLSSTETNQFLVKIKDNHMKVMPPGDFTLEDDGRFFTSVYLDTDAKTAMAACDINRMCKSYDPAPFEVSYDKYYRDTPFDLTKELQAGMHLPIVRDQEGIFVDDRPTNVYKKEVDGVITRFYVDNFYGVVLRVERIDSNGDVSNWLFQDASVNSLKDEDVLP